MRTSETSALGVAGDMLRRVAARTRGSFGRRGPRRRSRSVKILRHPPLVFWLIVVAVLGGVVAVAMLGSGGDALPTPMRDDRVDASESQRVRTRMVEVFHLAANESPALAPLAAEIADDAAAAAKVRAETFGADEVSAAWTEVSVSAAELEELSSGESAEAELSKGAVTLANSLDELASTLTPRRAP